MLAVTSDGKAKVIETSAGTFRARTVIYCRGPWISGVSGVPETKRPTVNPQIVALYPPSLFRGQPAFVRTTRQNGLFYGVPALPGKSQRAKLGYEQYEISVSDPENYNRKDVIEALRPQLDRVVSGAGLSGTAMIGIELCLYTMNPGSVLQIDRLDADYVVRCCSGHGFKYAPGIAKSLIDVIRAGGDSTNSLLSSLLAPAD